MTVYVDSIGPCEPNKNWKYRESCHMVADTRSELLDMARKLRLNPIWIQASGEWGEHFDLTRSKRMQALRLGAKPMTMLEIGQFWRERLENWESGAKTSYLRAKLNSAQ